MKTSASLPGRQDLLPGIPSGFAGREDLLRSSQNTIQVSNLLKGRRAGPKPHATASLRPPGSHLVRVAGWPLELLSGRPGRNEALTASGRPPMSG